MTPIPSSDVNKKQLTDIRSEDDLVKAINHLIGVGEDYHAPAIAEAERNYEYYLGQQQKKNVSPNYWLRGGGQQQRNRRMNKDIVETVMSAIHPQMVRGVPGATIESRFPDEAPYFGSALPPNLALQGGQYSEEDVADTFNMILSELWHHRKEYVQQSQVVLQALIEGVGYRVMEPYRDRMYGTLVRPRMIRRDQLLSDPSGTNLATFDDMKWMFVVDYMDAATIERSWGIKEREYAGQQDGDVGDSEMDYGMVRKSYLGTNQDGYAKYDYSVPQYPVHILYWQAEIPSIVDYRVGEDTAARDADRGNPMRMIVLINKKKIANLNNRRQLPTSPWHHQEFPVAAYTHAPLLHAAHGYSIVSKLVGPQDFVNLLYNQVAHNAAQRGNSSWLAEEGSISRASFKKVSMPRQVVMVKKGAISRGQIQEVPPGDFGTPILNFMEREIDYAKNQIGDATDAIQGRANTAVRSGRHAQTILEAASTQFAEYVRNLEAGHERAVVLEVKSLQQLANFYGEKFQRRFRLDRYPNIDLALANLEFDISLQSKADLPSTTIMAQNNHWAGMLDRGMITPIDYLKLTNTLPLLGKEWVDRVQETSKEAIPGVPFMQQMLATLQSEQQISNGIAGEQGSLPAGGAGLEEQAGAADGAGIPRGEYS